MKMKNKCIMSLNQFRKKLGNITRKSRIRVKLLFQPGTILNLTFINSWPTAQKEWILARHLNRKYTASKSLTKSNNSPKNNGKSDGLNKVLILKELPGIVEMLLQFLSLRRIIITVKFAWTTTNNSKNTLLKKSIWSGLKIKLTFLKSMKSLMSWIKNKGGTIGNQILQSLNKTDSKLLKSMRLTPKEKLEKFCLNWKGKVLLIGGIYNKPFAVEEQVFQQFQANVVVELVTKTKLKSTLKSKRMNTKMHPLKFKILQ